MIYKKIARSRQRNFEEERLVENMSITTSCGEGETSGWCYLDNPHEAETCWMMTSLFQQTDGFLVLKFEVHISMNILVVSIIKNKNKQNQSLQELYLKNYY